MRGCKDRAWPCALCLQSGCAARVNHLQVLRELGVDAQQQLATASALAAMGSESLDRVIINWCRQLRALTLLLLRWVVSIDCFISTPQQKPVLQSHRLELFSTEWLYRAVAVPRKPQ